jgi:hypothetical protein
VVLAIEFSEDEDIEFTFSYTWYKGSALITKKKDNKILAQTTHALGSPQIFQQISEFSLYMTHQTQVL